MSSPLVKQFEAPVQVTAITAGTTAARYVFGAAAGGTEPSPAKTANPCYITNLHTSISLFVKINPGVGVTATALDFDRKIPPSGAAAGVTYDLTEGGKIAVRSLSVWAASSVVAADIVVRGVTL